MTDGNLAALKRLYDRWAVGDWTESELIDEHIVGVMREPSPHVVHGKDALSEYTRGFLEPWDEVRIDASRFREVANSFVVWVEIRGTGSASEVELGSDLVHVWTFRGRRAIRFDVFDHEADALDAAGLSDDPAA
jgi:hypothetical protein